jgi:hypothetical protein
VLHAVLFAPDPLGGHCNKYECVLVAMGTIAGWHLGLLSFYLGIEVHQGDSGITLRQTAYAKRVVELAGLTDCNPALTPME